jgi:hypothetical protein
MKQVAFALSIALALLVVRGSNGNDPNDIKRASLALQGPTTPASEAEKKQPAKERPESNNLSASEEEKVLDFAKREDPELHELLMFLKKKRPSAYQQALRETGRTQQRLENLQQKDPELHLIDSQIWKTRSKLSLLAAQLSVKENEKLENQLVSLVKELDTHEVARIKLMRDRTAKQLEKLNNQLNDRTAENSTEKSLENWKNQIKKQSGSRKKNQ